MMTINIMLMMTNVTTTMHILFTFGQTIAPIIFIWPNSNLNSFFSILYSPVFYIFCHSLQVTLFTSRRQSVFCCIKKKS